MFWSANTGLSHSVFQIVCVCVVTWLESLKWCQFVGEWKHTWFSDVIFILLKKCYFYLFFLIIIILCEAIFNKCEVNVQYSQI